MVQHLLTFEIGKDGQELLVHGDEQGLRMLAEVVSKLADHASRGKKEHTHLMTEEWSGNELSSQTVGAQQKLLNLVTIHAWPKKP